MHRQHPIVNFQMEEIKASIELEKTRKDVGYKTLFSTPGNRRRMRIIMALAFFSQVFSHTEYLLLVG